MLIGLVVTIYLALPARHNVLVTAAIENHREPGEGWDLDKPTAPELRAWSIGVVGKDAPLPDATLVIGAKRVQVLRRDAALIRLQIGSDEVSYLVQNARGMAPKHDQKDDGDLRASAWRRGKFTVVAVGPASSAAAWLPVVKTK